MTQNKLPLINSAHGSETRNIINELIKLFNEMGYTYNESLQKAHDILDEAQQTNDMNENVQEQLNAIILENGNSEAEVVQARGNHVVLKDRLDNIDNGLSETVKIAKVDNEGQFPQPFRVPVLGVKETFPNERNPFSPLWVDGDEIYARGQDSTLRKSVDGGDTWEIKSRDGRGWGGHDSFLKLSDGTLLKITGVNPPEISRSTNDGESWSVVHTFRSNTLPLGSQSWAVDGNNGDIYMGEYNNSPTNEIILYRSTDNGASWSPFHTFDGELTSGDQKIRHIHAVQWDFVDERITVCTGDGFDFTGLWRVNAEKDGLEKILTNDMLPYEQREVPRAIGIMAFDDYIAWAGDTTLHPYIFRIKRSDIGNDNITVERSYKLNSTAWFTCKASDDNSRWVISASNESSSSLDNHVHLYAVEDQGMTVWEVGSVPMESTSLTGSIMPIGLPEKHGSEFWMMSRNLGNKYFWNFNLGRGFVNIPTPNKITNYKFPQTFNSNGVVSIPSGEEHMFAFTRAGNDTNNRLYILESAIRTIEDGGVSPAYHRLIVRVDGEDVFTFTGGSERFSLEAWRGLEFDSTTIRGGAFVEFIIKNVHSSVTIGVSANITVGWN